MGCPANPLDPLLGVQIGDVALPNGIILASGASGVVDELAGVVDLTAVGALTGKSITPECREGNPSPRIVGVEGGMLNAIGLANPGVSTYVAKYLPRVANLPCRYIASVAGHSISDYEVVASALSAQPGVALIEVNVSCPNTSTGLQFGDEPALLASLLRVVRSACGSTGMVVKLSPAAPSPLDLARVAIDCGACALTLANTVPTDTTDATTGMRLLSRPTGGLSGPAIHARTLDVVKSVYRGVARDAIVPIIGLGGVVGPREAIAFMAAGATCIGIGTALFADPTTPSRVRRGLREWATSGGCKNISELVGCGE